MLPQDALVVVADGHSAVLFRNSARQGLELTEIERVTPETLDRPSTGNTGAETIVETDPDLFARQLADYLNAMALRNGFDDVVVIADPSTLGILRKHYHKELQFRLRKEINKNLSNSDLRAIEAALS